MAFKTTIAKKSYYRFITAGQIYEQTTLKTGSRTYPGEWVYRDVTVTKGNDGYWHEYPFELFN